MSYEIVAALVDQIEALPATDLTDGLAARLTNHIERRRHAIEKAEAIYTGFCAELVALGLEAHTASFYQNDYVGVFSAETIGWKRYGCEELVDEHIARFTAQLINGHWQTSKMHFDVDFT